MIAEHRKCGGRGQILYDSAFRQQLASLETADFSKVNLYSTTFLAFGGERPVLYPVPDGRSLARGLCPSSW